LKRSNSEGEEKAQERMNPVSRENGTDGGVNTTEAVLETGKSWWE
jgi:hypothetical protein